ncbi:MAG: 4-alpha-glucanotransferase [Clostridia bacterium]|nr:4-alpha-glucanotransferase [Clostridia bacterium]
MNNCEKNFGFTHKSGILMPISSLPSPYGIGTFGKAAFNFIDFLDECRQTCWQVLPLNPTSYGDSPYQSPASIAGNPYFIDPDLLKKQNLLTEDDLAELKMTEQRIDYGRLFNTRYPMLRRAYARFVPTEDYAGFCADNASWLEDYALFMALKVHYGYRQWTLWEAEHRDVNSARTHTVEFEAEMGFWKWVQYEFMKQWKAVCDYAHTKGISIIGDMPIYVAHDSMDVWRAPEQFLLDENYNPTVVAGCPPDAYSEDGQLWGNPIYNWDLMQEQGFTWWVDRVEKSFAIYDLLRIDHFRGFAGYYTIPFGDTTARNGHWNAGPGIELFRTIRSVFPDAKIIAEDLGFITDDVRELLTDTDFPGMKVLQFGFYDEDSEYLPRMFETDNCIVYASTHDSDCTRSWFATLPDHAKERFKKECPRKKGQSATYAAIEMAMNSRANLAMIAMQDYLELTNEQGRMNVPSRAEGNWSWRVGPRYATKKLKENIRSVTVSTGRAK